jgi:hypothetical protein
MGPTSSIYDSVANGGVARELPVAPALLIRRDLAQFQPFVMPLGEELTSHAT